MSSGTFSDRHLLPHNYSGILRRAGFQEANGLNWQFPPTIPARREHVAEWLSGELRKSRESERRVGAAPVLNNKSLPPIVIADMAVMMIENCDAAPGPKLTRLFQELLRVDRHRKVLADEENSPFDRAVNIDAWSENAGMRCGNNQLARLVGVSPSVISNLRRSDQYAVLFEAYVEMGASHFREEMEKVKKQHKGVGLAEARQVALQAILWDLVPAHRLIASKLFSTGSRAEHPRNRLRGFEHAGSLHVRSPDRRPQDPRSNKIR
jgi:hypothetical protein